jgi:hypothetical protein
MERAAAEVTRPTVPETTRTAPSASPAEGGHSHIMAPRSSGPVKKMSSSVTVSRL